LADEEIGAARETDDAPAILLRVGGVGHVDDALARSLDEELARELGRAADDAGHDLDGLVLLALCHEVLQPIEPRARRRAERGERLRPHGEPLALLDLVGERRDVVVSERDRAHDEALRLVDETAGSGLDGELFGASARDDLDLLALLSSDELD